MKIIYLLLLMFFYCGSSYAGNCSSVISQGSSESCNVISKDGITWTLSTNSTVGQFVNGDYWVVDPGSGVSIAGISPGYTASPRAMNGSMINPHTPATGYDANIGYSAGLNVGISLPFSLVANQTLVSTISNESYNQTTGIIAYDAALTCLSSAPPSGSFRPGLSSSTKTLHNISDLDLTKLKKLDIPPGASGFTASVLAIYAEQLRMPWLDHDGSAAVLWMHRTGSGLHPYDFPMTFAEVSLMLHLNFSDAEKNDALINLIQIGIDEYSFIEAGPAGDLNGSGIPFYGWEPDGGHSNGRKWPILFAGIMLNYSPMKNIGQRSGDYIYSNGHGAGNAPSDYVYFSEDAQTFYVAQSDVDATHLGSWAPNSSDGTPYPYISSMIGMPEWGIRHATNRDLDNSAWYASYRSITSGAQSWAGTVTAARLMGAKSLWNNNSHFDYMDRYMAISAGNADPFGYSVQGQGLCPRPGGLIGAMYDIYKNYSPGTKYKLKSITQDQQ
jgi:hypothetical protein